MPSCTIIPNRRFAVAVLPAVATETSNKPMQLAQSRYLPEEIIELFEPTFQCLAKVMLQP
jgi:hypothetical protein